MSVYVDPMTGCAPSKRWRWSKACHMFADSIEELHRFAALIGMKREWFQNDPRLPHYDLNLNRRKTAVLFGAVEVGRHEVVKRIRGSLGI